MTTVVTATETFLFIVPRFDLSVERSAVERIKKEKDRSLGRGLQCRVDTSRGSGLLMVG